MADRARERRCTCRDEPSDTARTHGDRRRRVVDWIGADRAGTSSSRSAGRPIVDGVHLPGPAGRQGRPGRPQRRRQDHPASGCSAAPTAPESGHRSRRAGATGYLSQDPRSDAVPDDTNCLAHVLSGRGLDERRDRPREAPDRARGGPVRPQHRAVLRRPGALRDRRRLRGRVRGPHARRRPRPARRPPRPHPRRALRRRAAPRSSWRASCSAAATCSCSTSRPTTSTPTPATGCSSSCGRTAARCS